MSGIRQHAKFPKNQLVELVQFWLSHSTLLIENDGIGAQQKRGASASLARKSAAGYNYDESDDEFTTTTKTVTTTGAW